MELARIVTGLRAGEELKPIAKLTVNRTVHRLVTEDGGLAAELADDLVQAATMGDESRLTTWREIESRYSLGLIQAGLQNLIDAGIAEPQPIDPLAHAMLGMLTEAGLYVAGADDADKARDEMGRVLRGTLEGLRAG